MRRIDWNAVGAVVTAFATILLVAVTALLVKATNRLNQMTEQGRRSEKIRLTRDLYDRFFSLTASRTHAWFWLADFKPRESVRCFEDLWRVRDQGSFMEFYRVVAFWHSLYTLYLAEESEELRHRCFITNIRNGPTARVGDQKRQRGRPWVSCNSGAIQRH
jgi:hypothetical protein